MCGIIAYKGKGDANRIVFEGLKKLEYRGYDSWGMAWLENQSIRTFKCVGKIGESTLPDTPSSNLAVAHTRWATHGSVEEKNTHPFLSNSNKIAIVHNGIIENYQELKSFLEKKGFRFASDTDTEVIPNLIQHHYAQDSDFKNAFMTSIQNLIGSYAIVAINSLTNTIAFARNSSPLCIGIKNDEFFVASDSSAFVNHTNKIIYLEDNEYGFIDNEITIHKIVSTHTGCDSTEYEVVRRPVEIESNPYTIGKEGFAHFMLKEIFEEPKIVRSILNKNLNKKEAVLDKLGLSSKYLKEINKITLIGCGTAYYAALLGKYILEELASIDVEADYASEFRYRNNILDKKTLFIFISQSGETADTLAAQRKAKSTGAKTLSLVNVRQSTLARESGHVLYLDAGSEIGVASTKAFISQLLNLLLFAIYIGQARGTIEEKKKKELIESLADLDKMADRVISKNLENIRICAKKYKYTKSMLYIGRNINYPLALEGALKLKEISYIHAEGLAAGELKHGSISLVENDLPCVCLNPNGETYTKTYSNMQEIKARKGRIIAVATEGNTEIKNIAEDVFYIPPVDELLSSILTIIPLHLFAYYLALELGCSIDKPRNLAKSVTVE